MFFLEVHFVAVISSKCYVFGMGIPANLLERTDLIQAAESGIAAVFRGEHITDYLKDTGLDPQVFYELLDSIPKLAQAYARAKQFRAEIMANEVVHIADTEPDAQKARNRIQARQWYAAKINPKDYGDRIDVNVSQVIDLRAARAQFDAATARALRPMSDQDDECDAQTVEYKDIPSGAPTDAGSGGQLQAPESAPE